jgi:hypothetical protein
VSFEFHDLVKSNRWVDVRAHTPVPHGDTPPPPSPTTFYITFQAKPIGDPSSSHDIITFQAEISMEDELPVVQDCRIRSKQCFDECGRLEPLVHVSILSFMFLQVHEISFALSIRISSIFNKIFNYSCVVIVDFRFNVVTKITETFMLQF